MTEDQFEDLMTLWEDGKSMDEIVGTTGVSMALVTRFAELWYSLSEPNVPTLDQVLEA